MNEHSSFSVLRDPTLSDRELMLLVLYEVASVRADVGRLTMILKKSAACTPDEDASFFTKAQREAFAELEDDMKQFETRGQRPSQQ